MVGIRRKYDAGWALVFQLPNLVLISVFMVFPIGFSIVLAFTDWNFLSAPTWIGLDNARRFLADERALRSVVSNAWFLLLTVPPTIFLSFLLAVLLNRDMKGRSIVRTMYYFPIIISLVSSGILWRWLYARDIGLINGVLRVLGLPVVDWLFNLSTALPAVAVALVWRNIPLTLIIYLAAIQDVPLQLYEAADIDGAPAFVKLTRITWPLLYRTTLMLTILNVIWVLLGSFDVINVMTGGGPAHSTSILIHFLYQKAFSDFQFGYASFVGLVLFLFVLLMVFVQSLLQRKLDHE